MRLADQSWKALESPNKKPGRSHPVTGLIIHWTAAGAGIGSAHWFQDPKASASAHLVIDRDGAIYQCVDFQDTAWHAGVSKWPVTGEAYGNSVNDITVGIELANLGQLKKLPDGSFQTSTGKTYKSEVVQGPDGNFYEPFPQAQLDAAVHAAKLVAAQFPGLKPERIVGHRDIAPTRKTDPGPCWPMADFRAAVFGQPNQLHAAGQGSGILHPDDQHVPESTEDRSGLYDDADAQQCLDPNQAQSTEPGT
jgi:N-acetylmuramoyl-L-alanine amidase